MLININRSLGNFSEYQFKGNYNRCCNFPNSDFIRTSLNNNLCLISKRPPKRGKTKMKKKFTDEQLIREYEKGLSDIKIAKKFKCAVSTIQKRRYKLKLIANYKNWEGKILNENECNKAHKNILKKTRQFHSKRWKEDLGFREREFERDRIRKLGKLRLYFLEWIKEGVKENRICKLKTRDRFFANHNTIIIDEEYFKELKNKLGGLGK